ncbi:hypothetical protein Pmani_003079 [Petrolisthes manimaculis]|uniref:Mutator-like transposase domain-containing protein n=1 Tax=Petrolisthes manimaculis TaxID=1843537 RepID=A0AAE1UJT7_9EUCA|nr:hypothetical protein Pmani_003079 [Petrolisthes manimaculis]
METEEWMKLWKRSVEKGHFRYTTVISDGDSKAYSSIVKEKVYGDVEIRKDECINHVAKRVVKALRDYVQEKSRKGEGVGGRRGSLTQERVHYQIAKAITEFNFGFARSGGLVASGKLGKKFRTGQDVKIHKSFDSCQEKKEERRSKKRKAMEEAKKVTKEGTTYEAEAF